MISNGIHYSDTRELPLESILALYRANEWSSAQKPELLFKALLSSHSLFTAGWAGLLKWKQIASTVLEFVRGKLEPVVNQSAIAKSQLDQLTAQLQARVAEEKTPTGLGALTVALLDGEVVRLESLHLPQGRGQLHRLLSKRAQFRGRATLWPHRPPLYWAMRVVPPNEKNLSHAGPRAVNRVAERQPLQALVGAPCLAAPLGQWSWPA